MTDTTGKTVTLRKGVVVTDVGPGVVNGVEDRAVRRVMGDDGIERLVLAAVIDALPVTYRRETLYEVL